MDTKGYLDDNFINSHKYVLKIIEKHSRIVSVRFIKSKADATDFALHFVKYFEKQSCHLVRKVHTDGGTEFSRALTSL